MKAIYVPAGRAREYADSACNLYRGCRHGCLYCYAPAVLRLHRENFQANTGPRDGILKALEKDAARLAKKGCTDEILFCFTCDPYQVGADNSVTRQALEIVGEAGLNATVLTKGGMVASRDFDLLNRYGFRFGTTLVCESQDVLNTKLGPADLLGDEFGAEYWEPNAAAVDSRYEAIRVAHTNGIPTWVSLEPVIYPEQTLQIVQDLHEHVDFWKVGKMNHNKEVEDSVDWPKFRTDVTALLDSLAARYMLKRDLIDAAGLRGEL